MLNLVLPLSNLSATTLTRRPTYWLGDGPSAPASIIRCGVATLPFTWSFAVNESNANTWKSPATPRGFPRYHMDSSYGIFRFGSPSLPTSSAPALKFTGESTLVAAIAAEAALPRRCCFHVFLTRRRLFFSIIFKSLPIRCLSFPGVCTQPVILIHIIP